MALVDYIGIFFLHASILLATYCTAGVIIVVLYVASRPTFYFFLILVAGLLHGDHKHCSCLLIWEIPAIDML